MTELSCDDNQLSELRVAVNPVFIELTCSRNLLKILDVTSNLALESLECRENQLAGLDLSKNDELYYIDCVGNKHAVREQTSVSKIPGFDVSKVEKISGGSFGGCNVHFKEDEIVFEYNCRQGVKEISRFSKNKKANYTKVDEAIKAVVRDKNLA